MKERITILVVLLTVAGCGQTNSNQSPNANSPVSQGKSNMLSPEVIQEIAVLVRSGFYDKARIAEIVCEELYTPGELDPAVVATAINDEWSKWQSEQATWPAETDCDRLTAAFTALNSRGIIALENAGNTQSDGFEDFGEALSHHRDQKSVIGYCFYHAQDLHRAVRGEGLFLAFGPANPNDEESNGPEIGKIVCEELERAGLHAEWDGKFDTRIAIPNLKWQRR